MSNLSGEIKKELEKIEISSFEAEFEKYIRIREMLKKYGIDNSAKYELMPLERRHSYKVPMNRF